MFSKKFFVLFCLISLFQNIVGNKYPELHGIVRFPSSTHSPKSPKRSAGTHQHRLDCTVSFEEKVAFPRQIRHKKLSACTKDDFACLVAYRAMTVDTVYQQYGWYKYLPFREFLRTVPDHEERIRALLEEKKRKYQMGTSEFWGWCCNDYAPGLKNILSSEILYIERSKWEEEYRQQEEYYAKRDAQALQLQKEKQIQEAVHQQNNHDAYRLDYESVQNVLTDWNELCSVYQEYGCGNAIHIQNRSNALKAMQADGALCADRHYELNQDVQMLLQSYGYCDAISYTTMYGNQLQDALHQECIALFTEIAGLPTSSSAYTHQEALVDCIDAAREYNQEGLTYKASVITDFCSAFLAYSSAIVEGAASGLIGAVQDIIEHPIQTAVSVIAGKYLVACQLCKVVCNVADIGFTVLVDSSRAKEKWEDYIEPITKIIVAIKNKETTRYDLVRAGTALAVGLIAQHKLLGGLGKLYNGIGANALEFAQKNPFLVPQQYMQTADGMLLNATNEALEHHVTDHLVNTGCPASCQQMYEKLKIVLRIEEFTSIINVTKHGVQRLIERGFTPEETLSLVTKAHYLRTQSDGANVFIQNFADKYKIMVLNQTTGEVITALKNTTRKKIENLGKQYGWEL